MTSLAVSYGMAGAAAAAFQRSRTCGLAVAVAVARLRAAIEAADFWMLHEIDPQALLRRGGYAIGDARQILFFHPRFMARPLAADPAALLEAPLKLVVLGLPGDTAMVRRADPAAAFGRYGNPALAALGQELAAACDQNVTASLGEQHEELESDDKR